MTKFMKYMTVFMLSFYGVAAFAQSVVTGVVKDDTDAPLAGTSWTVHQRVL